MFSTIEQEFGMLPPVCQERAYFPFDHIIIITVSGWISLKKKRKDHFEDIPPIFNEGNQ